jgi:hypothetical protein
VPSASKKRHEKNKKQQRQRNRVATDTLNRESPSILRKVIRFGGWLFSAALAFAGLVAFLPRVSVDPDSLIDQSRPENVSFTITNTGIVPLTDIQPQLGICQYRADAPADLVGGCEGSVTSRLGYEPWRIHRLSFDERSTIRLWDALHPETGASLGGADISIAIVYRPWFLPFHMQKEFRFFTRLGPDHKLMWMRRPIDL